MPNRISQKLWPVEYWQNKKRQFLAGSNGRSIWYPFGLGILALVFAFTVAAGVITARPHEQAKHIPLKPIQEEHRLPIKVSERALIVEKPAIVRKQEPVIEQAYPAVWPLTGRVSHAFGWQQHPALKDWRFHTGVDLSGEIGQPVTSAISGLVQQVNRDAKTGLTVVITSGPWTVYHGSLSSSSVKAGEKVAEGQTIGQAGTAFQEPYPHVHLAIEKNGKYIDPVEVLPER